jgi:hypothetical protein
MGEPKEVKARGNIAHFATISLPRIMVDPNPAKFLQEVCEGLSLAGTHIGDTLALTSPERMGFLHQRAARCFSLEVLLQQIIDLGDDVSQEKIKELTVPAEVAGEEMDASQPDAN